MNEECMPSGCRCMCHKFKGVNHMVPCCNGFPLGFFEKDEPAEDIIKAFEEGKKGITMEPIKLTLEDVLEHAKGFSGLDEALGEDVCTHPVEFTCAELDAVIEALQVAWKYSTELFDLEAEFGKEMVERAHQANLKIIDKLENSATPRE